MLTVKSKYALAAVLEIASQDNAEPVQVKELSEACDIPRKYLELILSELKKEGLLHSVRGASGGYLLAKQANEISVLEIISTLEHDFLLSSNYNGAQVLSLFWKDIDTHLANELSVTIKDLLEKEKQLNGCLQFSI